MFSLEELNEPQREAVMCPGGPMLILAGAGSGKTRVIAYRIAYLIKALGLRPENILAVTFTNKAAQEMRQRVWSLLDSGGRPMGPFIPSLDRKTLWVGTFHSFCLHLLRKEAHHAGLKSNFVIYDAHDQLNLIKECLKRLQLDVKHAQPGTYLYLIRSAKMSLQGPKEVQGNGDLSPGEQRFASIYSLYQRLLREHNALDFDDLLMEAVRLLKDRAEVLGFYRERFEHLLVDEFQDTNLIQYQLIRLLTGEDGNLCCVGDDDQSIYSWRGAHLGNILNFTKDYPSARVFYLEQNYRSTKNILQAANDLIEHNCSRNPKRLWTENPQGSTLTVYSAFDEKDEACFIIEEIKRLRAVQERKWSDFAIFFRTNAQSRPFEEQLLRQGIPYIIVGSVNFYERKEIKDVMAYLKVIVNPVDSLSLKRVINLPPRGIGQKALEALETYAAQKALFLYDALLKAQKIEALSDKAKTGVALFLSVTEPLRSSLPDLKSSKALETVLKASGYLKALEEENSPEAMSRIDNLGELLSAAKDFEQKAEDGSIMNFLQSVALLSEVDRWKDEASALTLMTLHCAKGLEFPVVFIAGMEEGLLPHNNALHDNQEVEEERRLCYVGMTRAKEHLYMVMAQERPIFGLRQKRQPSRLLSEVPRELCHLYGYFYGEGDEEAFALGDEVLHPMWGKGRVILRDGQADRLKVRIQFDRDGLQRDLMVKYADLINLSRV